MERFKLFRRGELVGFYTQEGVYLIELTRFESEGLQGNLLIDGSRMYVERCSDPQEFRLLGDIAGVDVVGSLGNVLIGDLGTFDFAIDASSESVFFSSEPIEIEGNWVPTHSIREGSLTIEGFSEGFLQHFLLDLGGSVSHFYGTSSQPDLDGPMSPTSVLLGGREYIFHRAPHNEALRKALQQTVGYCGMLGLGSLLRRNVICFSRARQKLIFCGENDPRPKFLQQFDNACA